MVMDMKCHDPDVVNLHVHGLHVDPTVDDVVEKSVQPGDSPVDYNFSILPDHYPGLHWYHDHWHGTATLHLHMGLFGALSMVRSSNAGIDPDFASMTTRVAILHGLSLNNASLNDNGECNCEGYSDWFDGTRPSVVSNPLSIPKIVLTTICDQWCDMLCYQRQSSAAYPIQSFHQNNWNNIMAQNPVVNSDGGTTLFL
ncbi:hypothetical protein RFI_16761, partial [Reticulomyxa filosa]